MKDTNTNQKMRSFRVLRAGVETYFGTPQAAFRYWRAILGAVVEFWNGSRWKQMLS